MSRTIHTQSYIECRCGSDFICKRLWSTEYGGWGLSMRWSFFGLINVNLDRWRALSGGSLAPLFIIFSIHKKIFIHLQSCQLPKQNTLLSPPRNQRKFLSRRQDIRLETQWRAYYLLESTDSRSPLEMLWFLRKSTSQALYVTSNVQDPRASFAILSSEIITHFHIVPSHYGCHWS